MRRRAVPSKAEATTSLRRLRHPRRWPGGSARLARDAVGLVFVGTLLVVHHADIDRERALEHGFDPDDYVSPDDVRTLAVTRGGWDVVADQRRERRVELGAGAHHTADLVVRLLRR